MSVDREDIRNYLVNKRSDPIPVCLLQTQNVDIARSFHKIKRIILELPPKDLTPFFFCFLAPPSSGYEIPFSKDE